MKIGKTKQKITYSTDTKEKYLIYIIVFGAMISRGAFFTAMVIMLNIFFIIYIVLRKAPITIDLTAVLLLGLLSSAVISTFILDGNVGIAIEELLKYLLFPLSYIAFLNMGNKKMVEKAFYQAIILLAVAGLLAMAGLSLMPNMVIQETGRLQSFLQYANTTAMLLSAGVLLSVNYFMTTRNKTHIIFGLIMLADNVASEVGDMSGVSIEILKGNNRFETVAAINDKLTNPVGTFVIGYNSLVDALAVGSYAAANGYAIVLADANGDIPAGQSVVGETVYSVGGPTLTPDIEGASSRA